MMPLVSIVIPAYNAQDFIAESITSVLTQTFNDWELIIVDDGSRDCTKDIVRDFIVDGRISYIHQNNKGLAGARNTGILNARGKYIALLDADDLWLPEYLACMTQQLERNASAVGVYCGYQLVDFKGNPLGKPYQEIIHEKLLYSKLRTANFINACTMLLERSIYLECGLFDESLQALEDWDMWLRVSEKYSIKGIGDVLVLYRQHHSNMTKDLDRMRYAWLALMNKHFNDSECNQDRWIIEHKISYARLCLFLAVSYLHLELPAESANYINEMFRVFPEASTDVELYFQLACAHQPYAHSFDTAMVSWERAVNDLSTVIQLLHTGNGNPGTPMHRDIYSSAHYALGLLANACKSPAQACKHLLLSAKYLPMVILNRRFSKTLLANCVKTVLEYGRL